jgi:hypothetical protein
MMPMASGCSIWSPVPLIAAPSPACAGTTETRCHRVLRKDCRPRRRPGASEGCLPRCCTTRRAGSGTSGSGSRAHIRAAWCRWSSRPAARTHGSPQDRAIATNKVERFISISKCLEEALLVFKRFLFGSRAAPARREAGPQPRPGDRPIATGQYRSRQQEPRIAGRIEFWLTRAAGAFQPRRLRI